MKKILLLFAIVPFLCAFDYQQFPDLTNRAPADTVYDKEKNIFWQLFDIDENNSADVALGFKPNHAIPVFMMSSVGMEIIWRVDIDGVSASYYWMDLDGDSLPFSDDDYDNAEILHDPKGDGLNGNEESPFKSANKISL